MAPRVTLHRDPGPQPLAANRPQIGFFRHYSDTRSFPVRLHQIVGIMPAVTQVRPQPFVAA